MLPSFWRRWFGLHCAAAAGPGPIRPEYLVKLDSFLVAPIPGDEVKRSRAEILGAIRPAATLIYVPRLAEERFLVEIQAIAMRPPLVNKDAGSGDAR